jgi:hypothetical protein
MKKIKKLKRKKVDLNQMAMVRYITENKDKEGFKAVLDELLKEGLLDTLYYYCKRREVLLGGKILSPDYEACQESWEWFVVQLTERLEKAPCRCDNRQARSILINMQGIDVDRTLEDLAFLGGFCDCEILMNVDMKYAMFRGDMFSEA